MARSITRTAIAASLFLLLSQASAQIIISASSTPAMRALTSVGCFATAVPLIDHGPFQSQSKGHCQPICYELDQPVMGIVNGTNCYCGPQMPPNITQVDDSKCNTPCGGIETEMCGGANYWVIYLTGTTRNQIDNLDPASLSSSATISTKTSDTAPQTIVVTATGQSDNGSGGGSSTVGIAVGVVVGLIVLAGLILGGWLFMRQKRRRDAEDEVKRQMAVDSYVAGNNKHGPSNSHGDSRLDPHMLALKRESNGSINDIADYSRRILQVRNPDKRESFAPGHGGGF